MKKIHSVLIGILIVALLCPAAMAAEPEVTEKQRQAMDFVFDHGILQSDPTGAFQPHQPVSRAQMVGALYEMEGRPEVDTLPSFTDVAPEQPNAQAIAWAAAERIACGYGGGVFGPDDAMTHEQTATILWRYAQYHGEDVSVGEDTNILSYEDAFEISEYAISAMQWACAAGIMGGVSTRFCFRGSRQHRWSFRKCSMPCMEVEFWRSVLCLGWWKTTAVPRF